jgi:hypothetical protein
LKENPHGDLRPNLNRKRKRVWNQEPHTTDTIYFDADGKRCTQEQFITPKPAAQAHAMTVGEMARHFAAVQAWMRQTEAASA